MLPHVAPPVAFDVYRDGGSLGARFRDGAGEELNLFFHRRLDARGAACGFEAPELRRTVSHEYTSKLDGSQAAYATREDTPLSWEDAGVLLARIAPLAGAADALAGTALPRMLHAVATRGAPDFLSEPTTE
jgi:hypothetical protein